MRILKRVLKLITGVLFLLILIIIVLFIVDSFNSSYLKTKNIKNSNNSTYIINNVNIIPMTKDTILKNKSVLIKNGIIEEIGDSITNKNIAVINAQGKYLSPGLIDMHVHVWDTYELGMYLSYGVTSVRNLWGRKMHLRIKEEINNNYIIGPNFYTTSPKLTGPEFIGDDNVNVFTAEEASTKIAYYKEQGYDYIKTYYGLTKDIFEAIIKQSETSEIDIVAHPTPKVPYSYHFKPKIKTIEHTEDIIQQPLNYQLDTIKLKEVINLYKKNPNTKHSPTLIAYFNILNMMNNENILSSEMVKYINPLIQMVDSKAQFERWDSAKNRDSTLLKRMRLQHNFHLKILKEMNKNGIEFICSTDAGIGITVPGYSIHQELKLYKEAGLSNYDILKTATINASKTHKEFNDQGTIEIGKKANLLILNQNPVENLNTLKNPNSVLINGKFLDKDVLKGFRKNAKDRNNLIVSAIRYVEYLLFER